MRANRSNPPDTPHNHKERSIQKIKKKMFEMQCVLPECCIFSEVTLTTDKRDFVFYYFEFVKRHYSSKHVYIVIYL